jgi:hypothetical protein
MALAGRRGSVPASVVILLLAVGCHGLGGILRLLLLRVTAVVQGLTLVPIPAQLELFCPPYNLL